MNITIIGTGAYGISISLMLNENKNKITMYTPFIDEYNMLLEKRENEKVLKGVKIPENISISNNLEKSLKKCDIIFIMVPAGSVDDVSKAIKPYYKDQYVCIASKGIEQDTSLFVNDVFNKYIDAKKVAVLSGPSFAVDLASYVPIGLTLASKDKSTLKVVKKSLENSFLKIRTTDDVIGVEVCGSIKNIIAIASGIIDGMNLPESTKAMLITEALHDIKELIDALGGNKKTILSYAGIGDLLLTCTSEKSRNFTYGQMIGKKLPKEEIKNYTDTTTVEGFYTLKSIYNLIRNKNVDIPIIDIMYDIVFREEDPEKLEHFLITKE